MPYLNYFTDECFKIITDILLDDKPCWIARLGGSDCSVFELIYDIDQNYNINDAIWNEKINNMKKYNGYFYKKNQLENQLEILKRSADIYLNSIKNCDICTIGGVPEDIAISKYVENNLNYTFIEEMNLNDKILTHYTFIESIDPFLKSFKKWGENKKILIISPFEETIKFQIQNHRINNLINNYIFPNCEFKTYKIPITYNSDEISSKYFDKITQNYGNWIELAEDMIEEISLIDFDIAFISAGLYSMILGDKIKTKLHKKSLYIGGMLNVFFNFYGSRYDTSFFNNYMNLDYQIDVLDDFEDLLTNNNYKDSEGINAYFKNKK